MDIVIINYSAIITYCLLKVFSPNDINVYLLLLLLSNVISSAAFNLNYFICSEKKEIIRNPCNFIINCLEFIIGFQTGILLLIDITLKSEILAEV